MRFNFRHLLILILLAACTKKGGPDAVNVFSFDSEQGARTAYDSVIVDCGEAQNNCPESVAGVAILRESSNPESGWEALVCSGTLIAPNQILTNDHCLGTLNINVNDSCDGNVKFHFPKTKNKPELIAECAKVQSLSSSRNSNPERPDWIIFETKESIQRQVAPVNTNGVPLGTEMTGYPIVYRKTKNSFIGSATKNVCTSTMDHFYSTYHFHEKSALVTIAHCSIDNRPGQSGTAYTNSNGEVLMVGSFAVLAPDEVDVQTVRGFGQSFTINKKFVGGTNLACIPTLNSDPSPFCYFSGAQNFQGLLQSARPVLISNQPFQDIYTLIHQSLQEQTSLVWKSADKSSPFYLWSLERLKTTYNQQNPSSMFDVPSIPNEILEYVALKMTERSFPQYPNCHSGLNEIEGLDIPFVQWEETSQSIAKSGHISYDFFNRPLRLHFTRNRSTTLNGDPIVMSDEQVREYAQRQTDLLPYYNECRLWIPDENEEGIIIKAGPTPCETFNTKKAELDQWLADNGIESYLISNMNLLNEFEQGNLEVNIPHCD